MKVIDISGNPAWPCFLVQRGNFTLMLDCSLDFSSLKEFSPNHSVFGARQSDHELGSQNSQKSLFHAAGRNFIATEPEVVVPLFDSYDMSTVDAVLVSNHMCMLALPFLTERTSFRGKIFATEPTLQVGRLLMEELAFVLERSQRSSVYVPDWKQSPSVCTSIPGLNPAMIHRMRKMYSKEEVSHCLQKITAVMFKEQLNLFGIARLTAVSSGYSMGSANWLVQSRLGSFVYLSSSSLLSTHSSPIDQVPLRNAEVMLVSGLNQATHCSPDEMAQELCSSLVGTLKGHGNILISCLPAGILYELLEFLINHLDNAGYGHVPVYFVSPGIEHSLAHAGIYSEWLCPSRQSRVYLPEPPFSHSDLIKSGRIKLFPSVQDGLSSNMKTPCVVFCGHPSMRFGDAVQLLDVWSKSTSSLIVGVEPDFPLYELLAPYQPLALKVAYYPIDQRLSPHRALELVGELRPKIVVLPASAFSTNPRLLSSLPQKTSAILLKSLDCVDISDDSSDIKVQIDSELAAVLDPRPLSDSSVYCCLSGNLESYNNSHTLRPISKRQRHPGMRPMCGRLSLFSILSALEERKIQPLTHSSNGDLGSIILTGLNARIETNGYHTSIICEGHPSTLRLLKEIVVAALNF